MGAVRIVGVVCWECLLVEEGYTSWEFTDGVRRFGWIINVPGPDKWVAHVGAFDSGRENERPPDHILKTRTLALAKAEIEQAVATWWAEERTP